MTSRKKSFIAAALAVLCLPLGVAQAGPAAPDVPERIKPQGPHKVFLVGHATGVQIYTCNGTAWTLTAPRADIYGDNGKLLMTHGAGPSWTAKDGSRVTASRVDGVTVDPTAIPWLLLAAKGAPGPDGDRLAGTTYIQRINTVGGLAPGAGTCTTANAGEVREVPYTADYVFWKATGR